LHRAIVGKTFLSRSGQIAAWLPFLYFDGNTVKFVDNIDVNQVFTQLCVAATVVLMNSISIISLVGWAAPAASDAQEAHLGLRGCLGAKEPGASVRSSGGLGALGAAAEGREGA
jgi:hypothetical protein